ncbi:two-component system, response regulator [Bacillus sp. OxB-1]|uniref:response regulator transcription factor n=1 Tax=Bacillus sp. (strain OxB-1) TaxID=98228 RepID=UPI000581E400|nr:response regulator transcription factor [Bacillus sp. OxB-1]BAQ11977.1 two-component system, response regulator [Bacillus sp. OxB-1]
MHQSTILHVDDEPEIRELIGLYLKKEGYNFEEASNAEEALKKLKAVNPQLILLDVQLPDLDGIEICRRIRQETNVPVLFLSCKDSEIDKVIGLSVGGDDYIGKPFGMNELIARVKAHLRRYYESKISMPEDVSSGEANVFTSDSILLDSARHDCYIRNKKVQLSSKEFELLHFFMLHPFQVLSTEHLLDCVWGYESEIDTKTVTVHIGNLRKKLGEDPKKPRVILTLRGAGYKFNESVQKS